MHGPSLIAPLSKSVAGFRASALACLFILPLLVAAQGVSKASIPSSARAFNRAVFKFHQAEQEGLSSEAYLQQLSELETRFASGHPRRKWLLKAERCPYTRFASPSAAADYIALGITGASRADMPIVENMFRLCELNLQSDSLDLAGLDAVIARFNAEESPYQKAKSYKLRADINSVRGNLADALLDFQRARAAFRRAGVGSAERSLITGEGIARRRMGDMAGAETALNTVLNIWQAADNPRELAYTYIQLAYLHSEAGEQERALQTLSIAKEQARRTNDASIKAKVLLAAGLVNARSGNWKTALTLIGDARASLPSDDPKASFNIALSNYVDGLALGGLGRYNEAMASLEHAHQTFLRQKNNRLIALVLRAKADVLAAQHRSDAALKVYQRYVEAEGILQKKMRVEHSALLRQEYEIQSQAFETRQLRANRETHKRQLETLQMARRWQGLALFATLLLLTFVGIFAWKQWRRGRKLNQLANLDPLTGLANRSSTERFAEAQIVQFKATGTPIFMLLLDLDHFKIVNDTYGHLVGDIVLKEVSRVWSETLRAQDLLGRFGGEEFLALCPGLDVEAAIAVANRLRTATHGLQLGAIDRELKVSVSIGIARYLQGETHAQWTNRADRALYLAKSNGRDRVEVAPPDA